MAPCTTSESTNDPGVAPTDSTTQGVPNYASMSIQVAADNEEGEEADDSTTTLVADIELPRN